MNHVTSATTPMKKTPSRPAEILSEHLPLGAEARIHGVTHDGTHVWFATDGALIAYDPETKRVARRIELPGASAGTAFDGKDLYQIAGDEIVVVSRDQGKVLRRMALPPGGMHSGMAYADGHLWVGSFRESRVLQVDAKTGEVKRTLASDRFVTGVSFVDGELWHAVSFDPAFEAGAASELRRLAPDGSVEETLVLPAGAGISGVERTPDGAFWCGGEKGKLRRVRAARPA